MQTQQPTGPESPEAAIQANRFPAGELDLFALFLLLYVHRVRILVCAVIAMSLTAIYVYRVKPLYKATATMLIPKQTSSAAALAIQATAGLDLVGNGNEIYVDLLKSRLIEDRLINKFGLKKLFGQQELALTELALDGSTNAVAAPEGLLRVTVISTDPKLAADLANAYLEEMDRVNLELAIGSAGQQRRYYEQEMVKEKNALADAEVALKQSEEKTGVIEPNIQLQANLGATENTRAQLRADEVQLGALLQGETPQAPDVVRVKSEIASLEGQLQALQRQGGPEAGTPSAKAPAQVLDYVRAQREVKFHETLFDLLSRQYAGAKEQEARNVSVVQILDRAVPPERKFWPPRKFSMLAGFCIGGVAAILFTLLQGMYRTVLWNPQNRARFLAARQSRVPGITSAAKDQVL